MKKLKALGDIQEIFLLEVKHQCAVGQDVHSLAKKQKKKVMVFILESVHLLVHSFWLVTLFINFKIIK